MPWLPNCELLRWPFCVSIVVVLDHFSRRVLGFEVFRKSPSAADVCRVLERTAREAGGAPKYSVTDQGAQFQVKFRQWCAKHGVTPRFGAIGKHGSIAVLERFMRTLKEEGLRRLAFLPLRICGVGAEVQAFVDWYNAERPHDALRGATPDEVYFRQVPACEALRFEPRARYPVKPRELRAKRGVRFELEVKRCGGHAHLPTVKLRAAA